jgi:ABC-type transporter Mla MlaB component
VVFSFFKKDPKDARKGAGGRTKPPAGASRASGATDLATRPMPKPIGRPLAGPTTRSLNRSTSPSTGSPPPDTNLPERERMRHNARRTAEKIDAIEAEMARDLMGNPSPTTVAPATRPRISVVGETTVAPFPATRPIEPAESVEMNSEMLGGNIDAIEINTSGGSSVIDETAILFSNGQADAAETVLRAGLRRDDLGPSTRMAWHMLFELVNQRGDRDAFEKLTMDYALRFEDSPPAWVEYDDTVAPRTVAGVAPQPATHRGWPGVRLPESIDAGIVSHLEQLRGLTAAHAEVQLDVSDARRIDLTGASLLLRVVSAFRRSHRELTLVGAAHFAGVLAQMVESGRRDPSDALWMLLLEVLRMLDRQDAFEEAAIQYCITFEVSPPSWEPPLANLKVAPASSAPAAGAAAPTGTPMELRGTVDGEGEPHFSRLVAAAKNQPEIVIDCGRLRRLTFSAGSALVGTLRKIRQGGSAVELRNVSALVTALLHLLGITSIATVQSRYL